MKPYKFIALFALLVCSYTAFSQDILFFKNGTKDTVKVLEITSNEIVYKKFKRLDGPNYRVDKSEVSLIEFSDGAIEVIESAPKEEVENAATKEEKKAEAFRRSLGRNIISLNYMNIFIGNLNGCYERISANGVMGLKLSINYHIKGFDTDILGYNRDLILGADLNLYPVGQGRVRYFLGPAFRFGRWTETGFDFFGSSFSERNFNALSIMFNNGFYVQPTRNFFMSFQGGVGVALLKQLNSTETRFSEPDGIFAFNMGYRF